MTTAKRPATAKKPQDRKPKAGVVIVSGVELVVDKDTLDDFELLDDMDRLQNGDNTRLAPVMRRLTGDKFGEAMEALRGDDGRVRLQAASEFIRDVFEAVDPNS